MFDWDDVPEDMGCQEADPSPPAVALPRNSGQLHGMRKAAVGSALSYEVGGVLMAVAGSTSPDDKNTCSGMVPRRLPTRGLEPSEAPAADLEILRWMMQKVWLGQDMFLLGPPGPRLRHMVVHFCELFQREVEYVGITRDTNEADLKQRREIRGGRVEFVDQPPVRAALHGRVLILEGIEKAERNVLPLLNNLLENREMQLEDGRFLVAPHRATQLREQHGEDAGAHRLVPVHEDFIVVALGIPGRGNILDPPLRSRFSGFLVPPVSADEAFAKLLAASLPATPPALARQLCQAAQEISRLAEEAAGTGAAATKAPVRLSFPEGAVNSAACLVALFPKMALAEVLRRVYPLELLRPQVRETQLVLEALRRAQVDPGASGDDYCITDVVPGAGRTCLLRFSSVGAHQMAVEVTVNAGCWHRSLPSLARQPECHQRQGNSLLGLSAKELKAWLEARGARHDGCLEKADLLQRAEALLASEGAGGARGSLGPLGPLDRPVAGLRLSASQRRLVSNMLQDHAVGMDICLVGDKGSGKSAAIRVFAGLLGYRCRTVFCYKDMISRDLLQRRSTDSKGNTEWRDSPLVEAAIRGDLAVLDGVQRLATGTLYATLAPLLADREAVLPDGSRLVSPARWRLLMQQHGLADDCTHFWEKETCFRPVHPAFRCIAAAEFPGGSTGMAWLDEEVATIFHFHAVPVMPLEEQLSLATGSGADPKVFRGLLAYGDQVRRAATDDVNLDPLRLSLRVLLRIARYLRSRPGDVSGALNRAFSACLRFLPPSSQEAVDRLLLASMKTTGLSVQGLQRVGVTVSSETETRIRRQELRELENTAIQARMFGGYGSDEVDAAREKADRDRADQRDRRLDSLKQKATAAARKSVPEGARVVDGVLHIRDVACPVRAPQRPELVPSVSFVDIPQHVEVLRDMMLDWSLGHHLLLVGNQGVGKNRLTDRLLCLLQCEREYVQLHRDTTVHSLTLAPSLEGGVVVWEDSPLVRAVREGRCLVIDEADKAPLEVVCVLKALCEDGELALLDGRTIVPHDDLRLRAVIGTEEAAQFIPTAQGFRMIVLANRPGYPFLGNDFYRVCGDVFSCHAIDNPDIESEVALLRSVGPDVQQERIVQLSLLFTELRDLVEAGQLGYPYSTRELLKLVAHIQRYPSDPLEQVAAGVFAFDIADPQRRRPLLEVLQRHGIGSTPNGEALLEGRSHGDMNLQLDAKRDKSKDVRAQDNPNGETPPDISKEGPKHGKWDGQQHIGGNVWAGGSGGTGTAGLGGRWGPYRLDVGQELVFVSEEKKKGLDEATRRKAEQMADEAYKKRLDDIKMSLKDAKQYAALRNAVATQIQEMKVCLEAHEARERERQWLRNQTHGELDDSRLVDGITGSKTIYTRRGEPDNAVFGASQQRPKRITFVMDISGSMYTFNRIDRRLQRLQEVAAFVFESFAGFEAKYDYRMVGHSGTGPEAERLVEWGRPPRSDKDRLEIAKRMEAHAQYCHPGDHTLDATARAIEDIGRQAADERFVFVVSDADLQRYNIDVRQWGRILQKDSSVKAYVILISNNVDEAERIKATLAPGRAHICAEVSSLAITFKQIFKDSMLRNQ